MATIVQTEQVQETPAVDSGVPDVEEQVRATSVDDEDEHKHFSQRAPWLRAGKNLIFGICPYRLHAPFVFTRSFVFLSLCWKGLCQELW
jgi:hypothetical protein